MIILINICFSQHLKCGVGTWSPSGNNLGSVVSNDLQMVFVRICPVLLGPPVKQV